MVRELKSISILMLLMIYPVALMALNPAQVAEVARRAYEISRGKSSELHCEMVIVSSRGHKQKRSLKILRQAWRTRYRNLVKFTSPNDINGTGFLTWSYADKEDTQWIFLPALGKVRKISMRSKHNSFVGTDWSFDDMRERKYKEDNFSFIKEATLGRGEDSQACWVLSAVPKPSSRSQYEKMELYIRKDNNFLVGVRYFKKNKLYKLYLAKKLKQINGVWIAHEMEMKNLQKRTKTILHVKKAVVNKGLGDDFFSQRYLARR